MALTELARLRLEDKNFNHLFEAHRADWTAMAEEARALMANRVAHGQPTIDDIKKILQPMVEIDPRLRDHMVTNKALQKYRVSDFTDYILHRVYSPQLGQPA